MTSFDLAQNLRAMSRAAVLSRAGLSAGLLSACNLDVQPTQRIDPSLLRRIEQKKVDLVSGANGPGWTDLADLQLKAGQAFDAAHSLAEAERAQDGSARRFAVEAETFLELGYTSRIGTALRGCLQASRTESRCLYVLGRLMEGSRDRDRLEEARLAYRTFLQVAPDDEKANYVKSALDQLDRVLGPESPSGVASQPAQRSSTPPPPIAGTDASTEAGSSAVATPGHGTGSVDPETGQKVGELNPFGMAIMKAVAAVKRNDAVLAEQAFSEAIAIRPTDPSALAGRAEARFAQGPLRHPEAAADIEKAFSVAPQDPQVRWVFGLIMTAVGRRTQEGVAAWEALSRDEPEYARILRIPERLEAIKKLQGSGHE